ncbi:unnamed protein product [Peronospora belbahrii]|nr:unnamed protein product [Peronospora belbahrii]
MTLNVDDDVDKNLPHPIFEVVLSLSRNVQDKATLVSWVRQRRQFEAKICSRCAVTGEQYEHVVIYIHNSIGQRILGHLARFVLKKQTASVMDEDLHLAITWRCLLQNCLD